MTLKFCANLSFMFTETGSLLERYNLARLAGFRGVESAFPKGFSIEDLLTAKQSLSQVLINIRTGSVAGGEFGVAALCGDSNDPNYQEAFRSDLQTTVEYAKALECKKIHIMAGKVSKPTEDNRKVYVENLKYAANVLEKENIVGLIEPINKYAVPGYYLNSYETALDVLQEINNPHIRLQLDFFHLQHIKGNITHSVKDLLPFVGHVQIAQVPHRNEPSTPGEIDYEYVLRMLAEEGYNGWVGCEYHPKTSTNDGLGWIEKFGFKL
ncbi:putative hydroxypyruvate isomerase [Phlebotomus argentipes]|uniref:putative hydroxypyruvate isomerase n=1 Tax=Phlebotomus argentipes TaxID=94469 RepID=UPI002892D6D4|nr:putative hydroxypyruvate isomerase [Phlebotomus argentipes]